MNIIKLIFILYFFNTFYKTVLHQCVSLHRRLRQTVKQILSFTLTTSTYFFFSKYLWNVLEILSVTFFYFWLIDFKLLSSNPYNEDFSFLRFETFTLKSNMTRSNSENILNSDCVKTCGSNFFYIIQLYSN